MTPRTDLDSSLNSTTVRIVISLRRRVETWLGRPRTQPAAPAPRSPAAPRGGPADPPHPSPLY